MTPHPIPAAIDALEFVSERCRQARQPLQPGLKTLDFFVLVHCFEALGGIPPGGVRRG
jgi:hypothetical protein